MSSLGFNARFVQDDGVKVIGWDRRYTAP